MRDAYGCREVCKWELETGRKVFCMNELLLMSRKDNLVSKSWAGMKYSLKKVMKSWNSEDNRRVSWTRLREIIVSLRIH